MTSYQLAKNLPTVTLVAHQGCLIALDWHTQKTHDLLAKLFAKLKVKVAVMNSVALSHSIDADAKVLVETINQLKEYQAGQRQVFDIPIAIYTGTPFQQKVWQALRQIPYGETISYAQLRYKWIIPKAFAQSRRPMAATH